MSAGRDARGYSWPPFAPGHTVTLKHGAESERMVAPLAAAIAERLVADAPWLGVPTFAGSVAALARAEAQAELLHRWLDEVGLLDEDGMPRPALNALDRAETRADRLRQQLGLTPRSWAELHRTMSDASVPAEASLAELRSVGARMLAAAATDAGSGTDEDEGSDDDGDE